MILYKHHAKVGGCAFFNSITVAGAALELLFIVKQTNK
jgi:hypothetical protein